MADLTTVDNGALADYTVLTDEVTDGVLGTGQVQLFKLVDATVNGTNKAVVSAAGALKVDGSAVTQPVSGTVAVSGTVTATPGVVGGGTEATAERVTIANDSTGVLTVKQATATNLKVDASGVAVPITDNAGSLTVDQATGTNLHTVLDSGTLTGVTNVVHVDDNAASLTVDDANLDNATLVDNAGFTDGTTRVLMGGHIFDETADTALTENDAAASRIDSKRAQVISIEDTSTRGRRLAITPGGRVFMATGGAGSDGNSNNESFIVNDNADTANMPGTHNYLFNGTTWDRVRGDVANGVDVDVTRLPNVSTDAATTEPSAGLIAGWDGLNVRAAKVQNIDGSNALISHDPQVRRLLEEILIEARSQTALLVRMNPGVPQSDVRGDLKLVI